jgi:hypothetical protein
MTEYPICFVTSPTPNAFMPESEQILVQAESGVQVFGLDKMKEEWSLDSPKNLNVAAATLPPDGEGPSDSHAAKSAEETNVQSWNERNRTGTRT